MTRINVAIPPKNLTDQHLLAEHREIKRLCAMHYTFKDFNSIPKEFTLGTGHMKFFMDKGLYSFNRYKSLYDECLIRGFQVEDYSKNWKYWWQDFSKYNNYKETERDKKLLVERISERIMQSKQIPRYYGKIISKEDAIKRLTDES